jgi:endo-1,4-beta-xylanase
MKRCRQCLGVATALLALASCGGETDRSASPTPSSSPSSGDSTPSPNLTFENLHALAEFPVGVAVSAGNASRSFLAIPEKQRTIRQHFSQLTAGNIMKMSYLHPLEDTYTFDHADAMIDWASANGLSVHGHTLIWHSDYQVPGWMESYGGDFAAMLDSHVTSIATHFAGEVASWDVVNEAIDQSQANCFRDSLFYQRVGSEYIPNAFIAADTSDPGADLYYNDYGIGDGNGTKLRCLLRIVDALLADRVPIDGVGFQMHVQRDWPSASALEVAFGAIADRNLKVKITELDVPLNNPYADGFPQYAEFTADAAEVQKQRYHDIVRAYLNAVPPQLRGGITVWGLWDGDSWLLNLGSRAGVSDWPLLFAGPPNGPYEPKPAAQGFGDALIGQ